MNAQIANALTIIIPVYNAAEKLARCLESVFANTSLSDACRLLIIDDAGGEAALEKIYGGIRDKFASVVRNPQNLGYTKSINRAIALCPGRDVLLLNSDTMVTAGWIEKLRAVANSSPDIGTVTPVSNNAGEFSVPRPNENIPPPGLGLAEMAQIVEECGRGQTFAVPTGNGFCLYIRRPLLDKIGLFDEINFPRGYGEENDFCMRALEAGFRNLVALDTYIWHAGHSSFGESRSSLERAGLEKLQALYPDYFNMTSIFRTDKTLQKVRTKIGATLEEFSRRENQSPETSASIAENSQDYMSAARRLGKIIINYARRNGLRRTAWKIVRNSALALRRGSLRQSMKKIDDMYEAMYARQNQPAVFDVDMPDELAARREEIMELVGQADGLACIIDHSWGGGANAYSRRKIREYMDSGQAVLHLSHAEGRNFAYAVFYGPRGHIVYRIGNIAEALDADWLPISEIFVNELVLWDGPDNGANACEAMAHVTAKIMGRCGIAKHMVIHDFFSLCQSYNLLGSEGIYCGLPGRCDGHCAKFGRNIEEWRRIFAGFLADMDEITCFSHSSADIVRQVYPHVGAKIRVVPHKPLVTFGETFAPPTDGPLTIAVIGGINVSKGLEIVRALPPLLKEDERLVIIGPCERFCQDEKVVFHGVYQRGDLPGLLRKYGVTAGLVPSVWPETFCYVVQECMALGLPLVSFDLGAQGERIGKYEKGLLAPQINAESALETLRRLDARRGNENPDCKTT